MYSGLSRLTRLTDNSEGHKCWAALPNLQYLTVFSVFRTLEGVQFPASLRILSLSTAEIVPLPPDYLAPLGALSRLERLHLSCQIPTVPGMASLTVMSLDFQAGIPSEDEDAMMPDLAIFPQLQELRVSLCCDLDLPHLASHPSLCRILHVCNGHRLSMDIEDHGKFLCEARDYLGKLDVFD